MAGCRGPSSGTRLGALLRLFGTLSVLTRDEPNSDQTSSRKHTCHTKVESIIMVDIIVADIVRKKKRLVMKGTANRRYPKRELRIDSVAQVSIIENQ